VERGSRASVEMQSWCFPGWTETNHEASHVKIASVVRDETRTGTSLTEVWSVTTVLDSSVPRSLSFKTMRLKRRNKERAKETQREERNNARRNPLNLEREKKTVGL